VKHVFVSHSSSDSSHAKELVDHLEGHGISCWLASRDIQVGTRYMKEIPQQIQSTRYLIVLFSAKAESSSHVAAEVRIAFESNSRVEILPVRLDTTPLRDEWNYMLGGAQWFQLKDQTGMQRVAGEILAVVKSHLAPVSLERLQVPQEPLQRGRRFVSLDRIAEVNSRSMLALATLDVSLSKKRASLAQLEQDVEGFARDESAHGERLKSLHEELLKVSEAQSLAKVRRQNGLSEIQSIQAEIKSLRARRAEIGRNHQRNRTSFERCRQDAADVARDLFLEGRAPRYLRSEAARVLALPPRPPLEAGRIFGFLGLVFGLAATRAYWDALVTGTAPSSLDRYNRALARLFVPGGEGLMLQARDELLLAQSKLTADDRLAGRLSACVTLETDPRTPGAFRFGTWIGTPAFKPSGDSSGAGLLLEDRIAQAICALDTMIKSNAPVAACTPAMLADVPFDPSNPDAGSDLELELQDVGIDRAFLSLSRDGSHKTTNERSA
jgi:plasmid stabilization system protein ParE